MLIFTFFTDTKPVEVPSFASRGQEVRWSAIATEEPESSRVSINQKVL